MKIEPEKADDWLRENCEPVEVELRMPDGMDKMIKGWCYGGRADPSIVGKYRRYSIRHADDDDSIPATVETNVVVNHYADLFLPWFLDLEDGEKCDILSLNYTGETTCC